jgi:hypothetical protein
MGSVGLAKENACFDYLSLAHRICIEDRVLHDALQSFESVVPPCAGKTPLSRQVKSPNDDRGHHLLGHMASSQSNLQSNYGLM